MSTKKELLSFLAIWTNRTERQRGCDK